MTSLYLQFENSTSKSAEFLEFIVIEPTRC